MNNNQINTNQNIVTQANNLTEYQNVPTMNQPVQDQIPIQQQVVNTPPPKKKKTGTILITIILLMILAGIGYLVYKDSTTPTEKATNKEKEEATAKSVLTWKLDKGKEEDCVEAVETIYEDEKYEYTVPNSCVANYKIVYSDEAEYTLAEILNKKKITVEALNKKGANITKNAKTSAWEISKGEEKNCKEEESIIYETEDVEYKVTNSCVPKYKVVFENGEIFNIKDALEKNKVTAEELSSKGVPIIKVNKSVSFTIDKEGLEDCLQHLYKVAEDEKYEYSVESNCVANYKINFSNDDKYTLAEAIKKKKISVADLQNYDITIYKRSKVITWALEKVEENCTQKITTIYEDAYNEYVVPNTCMAEYEILYPNGDKITVKQALANNQVSINELQNKGLKIYMITK